MRRLVTVEQLRARWHQAHDEIDAAYWRFTRCKQAKPPPLVCPEAFRRQVQAAAALRFLGEKTPF